MSCPPMGLGVDNVGPGPGSGGQIQVVLERASWYILVEGIQAPPLTWLLGL